MKSAMGPLPLAAAGSLLLAAGVAAATVVDPYWLEAIPAEYQGKWNSDPKACALFTGRGRMELSGRTLRVGGDDFKAEYVAWSEDGGIGVVSRYAGSAKPAWTRVDHFVLSPDRKRLIDDHAGRKLVRIRCRAR